MKGVKNGKGGHFAAIMTRSLVTATTVKVKVTVKAGAGWPGR